MATPALDFTNLSSLVGRTIVHACIIGDRHHQYADGLHGTIHLILDDGRQVAIEAREVDDDDPIVVLVIAGASDDRVDAASYTIGHLLGRR